VGMWVCLKVCLVEDCYWVFYDVLCNCLCIWCLM